MSKELIERIDALMAQFPGWTAADIRDVLRDCRAELAARGEPERFVCEECNGAGVVGQEHYMGEFQPPERETCSNCGGVGYFKDAPTPAAPVNERLRAALRGLLQNEGLEAFNYLDKGIGTKTDAGMRWLEAREALAAADAATPGVTNEQIDDMFARPRKPPGKDRRDVASKFARAILQAKGEGK